MLLCSGVYLLKLFFKKHLYIIKNINRFADKMKVEQVYFS